MLCFIPTASIASRPARNASPADDPAHGPQRQPAGGHHQRDAEQLALGGDGVDLGVADERGRRHRHPAGQAAHGGRVEHAGRGPRTSRAAAAAASTSNEHASAPTSRWAYGPPILSVA